MQVKYLNPDFEMESSLYVEEYLEFEFDEQNQHIVLANYTCNISGKEYKSDSFLATDRRFVLI